MEPLLKTSNLSKSFGGIKAVQDFNIYLHSGELVGLIGPNGAGKTTAFNLLTGVYTPTTGTITFDGKSLVGLKPYKITKLGIARTFQNIRLFDKLTVLDNVKLPIITISSTPCPKRFCASAGMDQRKNW